MANNENITKENQTNELVVRREKLSALVEAGKNPFVKTKYDVTHESLSAIKEFSDREAELTEKGEEITVRVAGRMVARRIMGKASFAHISDRNGVIQVYVKRDDVGEVSSSPSNPTT